MSRLNNNRVAAVWLTLLGIGATGATALARPVDPAPPEPSRVDLPTVDVPTADEARALQQAGQWEEAAEAWAAITRQDDTNGMAWHYLGYCLHAAGRLDEAIEAHRKASTFDDYQAIALYNLGCAYALSGRPDEALEALAATQAAGWRLRDYVGSDSDLDSLLEDPRLAALLAREPAGIRGRILMVLARAQQLMNQHAPQAKQQLAVIMQQAAQQAQVFLVELQRELAKDERTAPYAQKLQQWLGGHAPGGAPGGEASGAEPSAGPGMDAMVAKAQQHQQAGEWPEAASAYGALLEYQPDNPGLCFAYAYALHMAGDYEKAIEAHQKSATFDQTRSIALYNLACAYALTGHTEEALEALKGAREAGFDISAARSDSDLESLRDDPRFKELLADGG